MRGLKAVFPFVLAALALSGCANGIQERQAQLAPLIGRPVSDLVQTLGVPSRTFETDGTQYLAYNQSRLDYIPGFGGPFVNGFYGPGFYRAYGGFYGGIPPEIILRTCETTFAVADGAVRSFAFRGNSCNFGTL